MIAVLLIPLAPATLIVRSVLGPLSGQSSLSCLLGEAVDDGDLATVRRLLAQGASPNARWMEGCTERTILDVHPPPAPEPAEAWATMTYPERAVLDLAVDRWSLAIVKELLDHGADPNPGPGARGVSPLSLAIDRSRPAVVADLIEHGADIGLIEGGRTALDRAEERQRASPGPRARETLQIVEREANRRRARIGLAPLTD